MQGLIQILHRNFLSKSQIHSQISLMDWFFTLPGRTPSTSPCKNPAFSTISVIILPQTRLLLTTQSAVDRLAEQSGKAMLMRLDSVPVGCMCSPLTMHRQGRKPLYLHRLIAAVPLATPPPSSAESSACTRPTARQQESRLCQLVAEIGV